MNTSVDAAVWHSEAGKLLVKRCKTCTAFHHYPRPLCPFCMSEDTAWYESTGRGEIYTYSVTRRKDVPPYVIAIVTLEEGIRLMTNIVDTPIEDIAIGNQVEVSFREVGGTSVPMFVQTS